MPVRVVEAEAVWLSLILMILPANLQAEEEEVVDQVAQVLLVIQVMLVILVELVVQVMQGLMVQVLIQVQQDPLVMQAVQAVQGQQVI